MILLLLLLYIFTIYINLVKYYNTYLY